MKIGLELFLRDGADAVRKAREVSGGRDTFLDLKLHDIPNTVAGVRDGWPSSPRPTSPLARPAVWTW